MTLAVESIPQSELGKYHLIALLARGGMGSVYLAASQGPGGFNKLVAVKELRPELTDDETYVAMFLEEARLAARLTHPNVVQTNEVGSEGDRHYMVMEYLDGRSLYRIARHLSRAGAWPLGAHLRVLSEALRGLHYAHELRGFDGEPLHIVHRDVSALNVLVTFDAQVKVVDFGIAKATDSSLETRAGVLKGRAAYMAPEALGWRKVDRRADVYAAGVILWEAAAGRRLWPDMTELEILSRASREGAPSLRAVRPDAPPDLDRICARAMAREPDDRYPTAAALLEELENHMAHRDDAMSVREIGARASEAFASEREQLNGVIETYLSQTPAVPPRSGVMPAAKVARENALENVSCLFVATPSHALSGSVMPETPVQPWQRWRGLMQSRSAALALFAVAATTSMVIALRRGEPESPKVTATPAPQVAAPPALAPVDHEPAVLVDVVVRVHPLTAQIALDGRPLTNPFHAMLPKDDTLHHIRAAADGYDPMVEDVAFARDTTLEITLERRPAPVAARVAKAPPPSTASSSPVRHEIDSTGGQSPLRPIVTTNPYGLP